MGTADVSPPSNARVELGGRGDSSATAKRQETAITQKYRLTFTGTGADIFSKDGLRMVLWSISIVGMPIGWLYMYRWVVKNTSLPTQTRLSFTGKTKQAYAFFFIMVGLGALNEWDPSANETVLAMQPAIAGALILTWAFGLLTATALLYRELFKWFCANLHSSSGLRVAFVGRAWSYIWWTIGSIVSIFTIVGWAWVYAAFFRWQFKNTHTRGRRFRFVGSGLDLLWRLPVVTLASVLVLPIPWIMVWLLRWGIGNIEIERSPEPAGDQPEIVAQ